MVLIVRAAWPVVVLIVRRSAATAATVAEDIASGGSVGQPTLLSIKPAMPQASGEWTASTAGGCPKTPAWATNPQFKLTPAVDSATYALELRQAPRAAPLAIGLWVMKADDASGSHKRSIGKTDVVRARRARQ